MLPFFIKQSRSVTKNDPDFFYVFRDCDGVSFRIHSFVIAYLKYLHMLPIVLTRNQFVICSCLFNTRGRVSGFCDNVLMYSFSKSFAKLSVC